MKKPIPYYEDKEAGLVQYHGDAREILPQLEAESISLLLTDPPYGQKYLTGRRAKFDPLRKPINGDHDLSLLRQVLPLVDRVMKNNTASYVFSSPKPLLLVENIQIISDQWCAKNVLVWNKGDAGTGGDLDAGYSVNWEAIIYAHKGRRAFEGMRPLSLMLHPWSGKYDPVHPAVKPIGLLEQFIKSSSVVGDVVLDCFAGSGTSLVAAKHQGRRAIGIEIDKEYCERTVARLRGSEEVLSDAA